MRLTRLAAAAAALLLAGCAASPTPRLYVLATLAEPGEAPAGGLAVGVGPVALAPHLDRPQIVTRLGSELRLGELDRWGEPLGDGIARVLAENLGRRLASERIWVHPWPPTVPIDVGVAVEVLRCDADEAGDGVFAARFTVFGRDREMLLARRFERREPAAAGDSAGATVEALSRALAGLSREIASALADLPTDP